uniref:Uncharacterized protein n=1 Tax=Quercus lobata TaxID=97700 RepID=A0A7N2R492_QUELO
MSVLLLESTYFLCHLHLSNWKLSLITYSTNRGHYNVSFLSAVDLNITFSRKIRFLISLSSYIKRYAGKNAKTDDLWGVLPENSGVELNSMMDAWSKKKLFPVISVKSNDNILEFEQSQFLSSGLGGDGLWTVPITLSIGSYNKCKTFLLETKSGKVDISELVHSPHENSSSVNEKNKEKCDDHF